MWSQVFLLMMMVSPFMQFVCLQDDYEPVFDGENAYSFLTGQCDFGPRPPSSENLSLCRQYIVGELQTYGWNTHLQNFTYLGVQCSNIIGSWSSTTYDSIILGAHYDTRPHADRDSDPANRTKPILGANDGASGVAVLLELARILPDRVRSMVEIVFFDAEDSGGIGGWDWIQGSTYYVNQLTPEMKANITAMVLVDIVGDVELRLLRERYSTDSLQDLVWSIAGELGYNDTFVNSPGEHITDDHRPFLSAGIPSLDIIQHAPFPWYWHTLEDTPDKCSAESLEIVGCVLETFLVRQFSERFPIATVFPMTEIIGVIGLFSISVPILYWWHHRRSS